jgi:hypothetical protein
LKIGSRARSGLHLLQQFPASADGAGLVVDLQPSAAGDGYEVVTGGIFRSGYVTGKKLLLERERAPRRSEPDATPSLRANPQNSGQESPSAEGQSNPNVAPTVRGGNGDVE